MTNCFKLSKISNGYLVEFETRDTETGEKVEMKLYFSEKGSAIAYVNDLME